MPLPQLKKELGQNFLKNKDILKKIINHAKMRPTDVVLEVGPGNGNLTVLLLERAQKVICYEKDPVIAAELMKIVKARGLSHKMTLVIGDVIKHTLPPFDICVSNLPFIISSPFIFKLLKNKASFRSATLILQKEFGDRLVASPGTKHYSRISVSTQLIAKIEGLGTISRKNFMPIPKVDACIVQIKPLQVATSIDSSEFDAFIKTCFNKKNKKLISIFKTKAIMTQIAKNLAVIKQGKQIPIEELEKTIEDVFAETEMQEARSGKMTISDFIALLVKFHEKDIYFYGVMNTSF